MQAKKWKFTGLDSSEIEALVEKCAVSPIVAQLLLNRGITESEDVTRFLEAKLTDLRPPEELPGLSGAVTRIMAGIEADEEIVVYGDYDADGMTATAILYRCLKLIQANVVYHMPNRMEEGYGLHAEAVEKLHARGKKLVITVDCGIASIEAAKRARELGLGLIVTDHHRYGDELPVADAIVHPSLPGTNYPFTGLCGAGVAFKLAWALCQAHCGSPKVSDLLRDYLLQAVGLASIATVADVVPLLDENRVIVRNGLKTLRKYAPLGLKKLMAIAKLDEKQTLDSEDFGFSIAPRLNAAGRLGQAQLGVELLITEDEERATALATYIDELNGNRSKLERSIHLSASKQLQEVHSPEEDPAFVLASPNWHPGVIGIVAGRLAEKHHKPVVLVALDKLGAKPGTGSGRSPNGVNLHAAFQECSDWLVTGGGHAAAAGMKVEEAKLNGFRNAFLEAVAEQSSELESEISILIDAEATLDQLTMPTVAQIEQLAPFGQENSKPTFCALNVELADEPKVIGASGKTLSLQFAQYGKRMRAVAFGCAEEWLPELLKVEGTVDVAFRPVINEFRGFRKVEMQLMDWRVHANKEQKPSIDVPEPHLEENLPSSGLRGLVR
ncbi:MAG: single-stranded-DNA-specific exonuclease RecJ [Planctomycetota bacterium]